MWILGLDVVFRGHVVRFGYSTDPLDRRVVRFVHAGPDHLTPFGSQRTPP